jgi:hypothetical protein
MANHSAGDGPPSLILLRQEYPLTQSSLKFFNRIQEFCTRRDSRARCGAYGSRGSIWCCPTGPCRERLSPHQELRSRPAHDYNLGRVAQEGNRARRPTTDGSSGVLSRNRLDDIFNRVGFGVDQNWYRRLAADAEAALYMCSMEEPARSVAAVIDDIEPTPCHRTLTKDATLGFDWRDRGRLLCNAIRQLVKRQCAPHARRSAS